MALTAKSLFLYGIVIDTNNQNIPFKAASLGAELTGVIPLGYYSLTDLAVAIKAAMQAADATHTYTVTVNRTTNGGQENRVTIATSGSFLSLLFSSGATATSSIRSLMSWGTADLTGATTYTNSGSTGTALVTSWWGKNYMPPQVYQKNFGSVNVSTNGTKEGITWSLQRFIGVTFDYEAQAQVLANWNPLLSWMIQQKPFEFTPEISAPTVFYPVTLEKSTDDGKGLGFNMKEMLPNFPFMFSTGAMVMRVIGEG
jgi:hypothetical protein